MDVIIFLSATPTGYRAAGREIGAEVALVV